MGRSRYRIFENEAPYFLTCTFVGWLPIFTRPAAVEIVIDSWRFLRVHGRIELYGYVILENHLHFIATSRDLAKEVGDFKSYTARRIVDLLVERRDMALLDQLRSFRARHKWDREFQVWQEGSHPQQITGDEMMRQKLEYMHQNPVKRGYVDDPLHWRYSSARCYEGLEALFPVAVDWF